ncbi:RsmE family RNA methyltransferase [Treponema bryantii]|uniref:RsmE family RNA methyltransferase n=1 Tax=Treponema bryantii TaxID=163 RepID=UPI0003B471C3|nr:16S rRNA (uracil(1498)-N(3))-methyltransferase [Treponema bryantii]
MRQLIVENRQIHKGLIQLEGKDYRYLRQVLRVRAGDMISVRLPDGSLNNATVAKIDENNRCITLQICAATGGTITRGVQAEEISAAGTSGRVEYWLFQFLPRPQKFELIVRQATECGVAVIVPVIGEYTEKSSVQALEGAKKERLERIIKEARQQSGSPVDTRVTEPMSLEQAIDSWKRGFDTASGLLNHQNVAFVLSERDDCSGNLGGAVQKAGGLDKIKKAAIAVGSEGGISPDEVRLLEEKGLFVPIHFAVNILRCETAALYGIAAVQSMILGGV